MLLKVLVYAYLSKVYSSRRIAKVLLEDVNFMWLSATQCPNFCTTNEFRSSQLKEVIDEVFDSMMLFLIEHGYTDLKEYFVDGTRLRADSNRHKIVWAKNTKRYKQKAQQKVKELLSEIERPNDEGTSDAVPTAEAGHNRQQLPDDGVTLPMYGLSSLSRRQPMQTRRRQLHPSRSTRR